MDGSKQMYEENRYLENVKYELFLSYAAGTDKAACEDDSGWGKQLYTRLKADLNQACPNTRIFFDQCELPGNADFSRIQQAVEGSACFLAIVNPLFVIRTNCQNECRWFEDLVGQINDKDRVFPAYHRPVPDCELPNLLRLKRGFCFYNNDESSSSFRQPFATNDDHFHRALQELVGAIESKLNQLRSPGESLPNDKISLRSSNFEGRRLRSRIYVERSLDERLALIDNAHRFYAQKLDSLKTLCNIGTESRHATEHNAWASKLFGQLADFPVQDDVPSLDELGAAIREFSQSGFPMGSHGIVGASTHEFFDQLLNNVIGSIIEADIKRPPRILPEDWFYDFYFRTFAECWEEYKSFFRWLKVSFDFDEIRAHMMAEHLRAQIRLTDHKSQH